VTDHDDLDATGGPVIVRKRPVMVMAYRYTGDNAAAIVEWAKPHAYVTLRGELIISTLEGEHRAEPGDWVMRGVEGEYYPCKPSIFAATYDELGPA
jgi:hypothetical protein